MNLNKRELNEHVEFESQTYYAAFAAELEACAQPMWGLLTHCKVKVSSVHTQLLLCALLMITYGAFTHVQRCNESRQGCVVIAQTGSHIIYITEH